jgi:hypothetical protein
MPDTMEYFIDSASTVDTPPVTTVRDWSGRVLVELERADITKLTATGWTPPERFCVKAVVACCPSTKDGRWMSTGTS